MVAKATWLCTWLCRTPMTLGKPLSLWEARAPNLNVEIRVLTLRAVRRPELARRRGPPRSGGVLRLV